MKQCAVCKKTVEDADAQEHLANNHLGPHYFHYEGQRHKITDPSMLVMDLKRRVRAPMEYSLFEEREGGDIGHGDAEHVDLTQAPRFYSAPPAAMGG